MKALRTQAEWCAKAQWILGLVLLLLVGGFFAVIYRPNSQQLRTLNQQIAEKRTQLSSNRTRVQILPDVMLAVSEKQGRLEKFDKRLPKQPELSPFITDVTLISHQASLREMAVKPGVPARNELYCEFPISFTFEGDFKSVFAFLAQTEKMDRLTRVKSLKVRSPDSGKSGRVHVDLAMNIYYSEG